MSDVQAQPFVRFDSNDYAVDPAVIGRKVLIIADLSRVEVLLRGPYCSDLSAILVERCRYCHTLSSIIHAAAILTGVVRRVVCVSCFRVRVSAAGLAGWLRFPRLRTLLP